MSEYLRGTQIRAQANNPKCPKCGSEKPGIFIYCTGHGSISGVFEGVELPPMCQHTTLTGKGWACAGKEHLRVKCTCGYAWDQEPLDKSITVGEFTKGVDR